VIGRDVGTTNYQARVWLAASGAVQLQLLQGGTAIQLVEKGNEACPDSGCRVGVCLVSHHGHEVHAMSLLDDGVVGAVFEQGR